METMNLHDGNITHLLESRGIDFRYDFNQKLQMHSSLIRRLSHERELEGHDGCVNDVSWNSRGSLLISGSDDGHINIWSYAGHRLLHSIESGHSNNIFCTRFVPETSDELVVSGAGDSEVRLFNLSRLSGRGLEENAIAPSALFQCHSKRVKKLAVEVGNPNMVWSASEDGTLRQHDFREGASCPPAGASHQECRNVLLDLRCGAKRSLADAPKQLLALKSCDISLTRPHLFLVGGSDAFARLYDRRMLPPLTSCSKRMKSPPCVNYLCPMHLSERGRASLHLTHVTFSPNGEEVLLSYSNEHVYLMDVDYAGGSAIQYTSGDVSKLMNPSPFLNVMQVQSSNGSQNGPHTKTNVTSTINKCRELLKIAEKSLTEGTNYFYGIEACNEVLNGHVCEIELTLRHDCLCTRAALYLKRKWKNDVHMAIRDCNEALRIITTSVRALLFMSEALVQLGKHEEALDFATAAQCLDPYYFEVTEKVENIKRHLAEVEAERGNKGNNGAHKSEPRGARVLSLSDIFYREMNSDAPHEGPRSEREDSDYDEELELDFETSISGDEGQDVESNTLHGSLNLRIRRGESNRESRGANGSSGSPTSSSLNDRVPYQPEAAIDMRQRFVGHCNIGTDIKQASFLGLGGKYVASGSDCGRWFIWEKRTGRLIKMLAGDETVVNCVQCHPFDCVVATSGIDNTIKIWTPTASVPSIVAGGAAGPETADVLDVIESNQRRLCRNRETILPIGLLERIQMQELTEGSLHPFECAQS